MVEIRSLLADITTVEADAIVNAANNSMRGGGGVDGAIHRRGGPAILTDCIARFPDGLATGDAGWTTAGDLAARWVIHTVGPNRHAGETDPRLLASCFRRVLEVADQFGARHVAAPLVGAGAYGWQADTVAEIAIDTIDASGTDVEVFTIVAFSQDGFDQLERVDRQLAVWTPLRILQGVAALHRRGLGGARVLPYLSPSGLHWRVAIDAAVPQQDLDEDTDETVAESEIAYSSASGTMFADAHVGRATDPDAVADLILDRIPAIASAPDDAAYREWYAGLMDLVVQSSADWPYTFPVAFSDYSEGSEGWEVGDVLYPHPPPIGA